MAGNPRPVCSQCGKPIELDDHYWRSGGLWIHARHMSRAEFADMLARREVKA